MTPERWQQIKDLFEAALEHAPSERSSFLKAACQDESVRADVESLLSSHARAAGFRDTPVLTGTETSDTMGLPSGMLSPGQVLSGRFQVVRLLGRGGMGEVYEAKDLDLGERVALKTIRPEVSADPRSLARFKQEIHLARRVTHPNVCRMFDLEHHRPTPEAGPSASMVTFLTMELLEGETLASRLRHAGRMTTAEALPLVQQMTEALAAAHEVEVVHRDFKPGNVILVPAKSGEGMRAVVTDFGLARAVAAAGQAAGEPPASTLTGGGHIIGTIAYMAPEQLEGAEATPLSDIYALGLVMYEMIAGKNPFPAFMPGAMQRVKQPPASPCTRVRDLDPRWELAIMRCLKIDPALRFQSARDVAKACSSESSALVDRRSEQTQPIGRQAGRAVPFSAVLGVCVVAALALFWLVLRIMGVRPTQGAADLLTRLRVLTPVNERDWILVADFENQTGDKQFDRTVSALVSQALQQSTYVNVVPRLRALEGAKRAGHPSPAVIDAELGRDLCIRDGYRALLTGQVSRRGSAYFVALQVVNPRDQMAVVSLESQPMQSAADLYKSVDELAARLRGRLGESLPQIQKSRPLASVTTPNLEALARYQRALELYAALDVQGSVTMAKSAVDLDPHFAMAHLLLASNYDYRANVNGAREQLAIARQEIDHVTDRERHLILARSYYQDYLYEKAAEEYRFLMESNPGDVEPLPGLAETLFWSGQMARGLELQRQVLQIGGAGDRDYHALMTTLIYLNRFPEALKVYQQARGRRLENVQMYWGAAVAQWGLGDLVAARREFESLANSGDSYYQDLSKLYLAELLIYDGDLRGAIGYLHSRPVSEAQTAGMVVGYLNLLIPAELALDERIPTETYLPQLRSLLGESAHPEVLRDVGLLALELGDLTLPRRVLDKIRMLQKGQDSAYLQCEMDTLGGALALAEGQIDTAIETEQRATLYPLRALPYFILGKACRKKGDWAGAIKAYEGYLARKGIILRDEFPGNWALAHLFVARAYAQAGSIDQSRHYYDEFLRLWDHADPSLPALRQARAERSKLGLAGPMTARKSE